MNGLHLDHQRSLAAGPPSRELVMYAPPDEPEEVVDGELIGPPPRSYVETYGGCDSDLIYKIVLADAHFASMTAAQAGALDRYLEQIKAIINEVSLRHASRNRNRSIKDIMDEMVGQTFTVRFNPSKLNYPHYTKPW